jgi:hypothetical protein
MHRAAAINWTGLHGPRPLQKGTQQALKQPALRLKRHLTVGSSASQPEIVSSQASSLQTGRSWTHPHVHLIDVGERVQVLLRGLDLRMSHPIHHALEIRAASEKPRRVRVPKIMYPNTEVEARRFDSRQPHSGSEGVTRDWSAHPGAGYDISVRDGSARRSGQLWGMSLTCANTTYPKGVRPGVQRR